MRRAHDALKHDTFVENKDTGELHRPHHLDLKLECIMDVKY